MNAIARGKMVKVSISLPIKLSEWLDHYCSANDKARSRVIVDSLKDYAARLESGAAVSLRQTPRKKGVGKSERADSPSARHKGRRAGGQREG